MIKSTNIQKAEYLLKMLLFDPLNENQISRYDWASESSRWDELVTILMSKVCELPEDELRELTTYLSDLGQLKIEKLAEIDMGASHFLTKHKYLN